MDYLFKVTLLLGTITPAMKQCPEQSCNFDIIVLMMYGRRATSVLDRMLLASLFRENAPKSSVLI